MNEYQQLTSRTNTREPHSRDNLTNLALGLTGEAGEVVDQIKKHLFHGHDLDRAKLANELGDVLWYVAQLARAADLTLEEIAAGNIDKLRRRYPEGFSVQASRERVE